MRLFMCSARQLLTLALTGLFPETVRAQSHIFSFNGELNYIVFGASVSGAGDVNKDGYPDLVVAALGDSNTGNTSGSARVLSGCDGRILYAFNANSAGKANGRLTLPRGLVARLVGTLLHHAYLVIGLKPLSFDIANNPGPLTLRR